MGFYTCLHLLFSPTALYTDARSLAAEIRTNDPLICEILPMAIVLGQIIPTIFMALPLFSVFTHQWLNALWQAYPIWTLLFLALLRFVWKESLTSQNAQWTSGHSHASDMRCMHKSYLFAFAASAIIQNTTYIIFFLRKWLPGLGLQNATLAEVFKPEAPWYPVAPIKDAAAGARTLFQYDQYFGSTATVVWAVLLLYNAHERSLSKREWAWLAGEICVIGFSAGPAAAAVTILWHRDEYVMSMDERLAGEQRREKHKEL